MSYDPPAQNLEAEDAVIGSLLLDSDCLHTFTLPEEDFFGTRQRDAYGVICDLVLVDHRPVDVLTVHDSMVQLGNNDPKLLEWLTETAARVPTTKNVAYYAQIIARTATKRRTERALTEQLARVRTTDVADIATATEAAYRAVLQATDARARIQTSAQVFDEMVSRLVPKKDRKLALLRTGIGVLDQAIGGIPMGCATMVGGRTSMGKSCLCRNVADNVSRAGFGVGYISLEDSSIKTSKWMALRHARVPIERVTHDLLTRQEIERIKAQRENLAHRPLYFCDQGALTGGAICQRARQMIAMGCRLIVLDFVNRAKLPRSRSRNEELMDEVVGPICDLAKESEVAFMVAAQLNRESERDARPPQLIDFKDCGGIEESAEVALLVHRQNRIRQDEKKPRLQKAIDIIVAKQKEGECRTVRCYFEGPLGYVCDPPEPDFFNDLSKGLLICKVEGCKKLALYDEDRCGLHLAPPEESSLPFQPQENQVASA
jgi:replicative DNA helicase